MRVTSKRNKFSVSGRHTNHGSFTHLELCALFVCVGEDFLHLVVTGGVRVVGVFHQQNNVPAARPDDVSLDQTEEGGR